MTLPPDFEAQKRARELLDDMLTRAAAAHLQNAIIEDVKTLAAQAQVEAAAEAVAEERLVSIETQTQALTEAVIDVAAAVKAVEQRIDGPDETTN